MDESLSFLDDIVSEALSNGASPYIPVRERDIDTKIKGQFACSSFKLNKVVE